MSRAVYDIGDKVRITVVFKVSGTLTDPTSPSIKVKEPSGTTTTYATGTGLTKSATGTFYADVAPDEEGVHHYRAAGTGNAYAAEEGSFEVRGSKVI